MIGNSKIEKINQNEHSAIEAIDSNITISHSIFDSNYALKGGAINLLCDWQTSKCVYEIAHN